MRDFMGNPLAVHDWCVVRVTHWHGLAVGQIYEFNSAGASVGMRFISRSKQVHFRTLSSKDLMKLFGENLTLWLLKNT